MKKKHTKSQKNKSSKEELAHIVLKAKTVLAGHGLFVMFLLAGASIGFALYRAQTYLDPARDEAKYQELSASSFSKIDYTLVDKLSEALKDTDATASQNVDPTRKNPFSE